MVRSDVEQSFAFAPRVERLVGESVVMAAPECEREARKRRERRDSGCAHERKERRPHSEERAPAPPMPPLHDYNRIESERRAERLSRARRPQFGGKRRRQPPRDRATVVADVSKENDCLLRAELAPGNASPPPPPRLDASPSNRHHQEPATAGLDLAALHLQLGRSEPARSHAAERARPVDPAAPADPATPPRPRDPAAHTDKRLDKINKKIGLLKRNISRHESECESRSGHALSAGERATDVQLTRMSEALRRLQAEKRLIKSDPLEYTLKVQAAKQQKQRDEVLELALHSDKSMADVVLDIEQWLEGTRTAEGRSGAECSWSGSQLAAEKACVQRVLLRLEAARGRPPAHSADRGAARHIYDRYRTMKRLVAGLRADAVYINGELATIHEHETMCFSSTDSDSKQKHSDTDQESSEPVSSPTTRSAEEAASTASSARSAADDPPSPPSTDALHCLTPAQLAAALSEAHALKLVLRRSIKEYEFSVRADQSSRKLQPEDKIGKEDEYRKYKAVKARIKLLNALINKQKLSQQ